MSCCTKCKRSNNSKVREADKSNQYEEYKDKVGEIAVGIVKRTEFGNLIIDLGKSEAIIKEKNSFQEKHLKMVIELGLYLRSKKRCKRLPSFLIKNTSSIFIKIILSRSTRNIRRSYYC